MIDTHAHIYLEEFSEDLDLVISRAREIGIQKILMPNIDRHSIASMIDLESRFPETCFAMMGLHPCYVKEDFEEQLKIVEGWFQKRSFLAVGEIGTDLYWDKTYWKQQQEAFYFQCDLALNYSLPVVIHCRDSMDETIELVKAYAHNGLKGVFHCFNGTIEQGKMITEMGFYLGLGGVSTFKNAGMNEVIPHLDQSKILLETDSPYLAPTPKRGKRNEPFYLNFVAEKVSEFLNVEKKELIEQTNKNANALFFST